MPGVKPPAVAPKSQVTKPVTGENKTQARTTPPPNFRRCSKPDCPKEAVDTVKFFPSNKEIVRTPRTPTIDRDALDLCQSHSDNFVVTQGWHLVNKQVMPTFIEQARQPAPAATTSNGGSGCFDFLAGVVAVIFLVAVAIGAGYILIEFLGWLFSGTGSDDSTVKPFRMPRWRR